VHSNHNCSEHRPTFTFSYCRVYKNLSNVSFLKFRISQNKRVRQLKHNIILKLIFVLLKMHAYINWFEFMCIQQHSTYIPTLSKIIVFNILMIVLNTLSYFFISIRCRVLNSWLNCKQSLELKLRNHYKPINMFFSSIFLLHYSLVYAFKVYWCWKWKLYNNWVL